jgi:hypothetical protein
MSKNGKTVSLVAAALLLSGLSLIGDAATDARAESAYPNRHKESQTPFLLRIRSFL